MAASTRHQDEEQQQHLPLAIGVTAIVTSVVGLLIVAFMVIGGNAAFAVGTEAESGDLSVWVDRFEWLDHAHGGSDTNDSGNDDGHTDHDHGDDAVDPNQEAIDDLTAQAEGFAMPASMMPGTPVNGFQRIQVNLTIVNRGGRVATIAPADFLLTSAGGDSWLAGLGGTFAIADIGQRQLFNTVVAFDVPDELSGDEMYLVWDWEGEETRFSMNGSGHSHG